MRETVEIASSVAELDPAEWDALAAHDNPFVEHAFLAHLERSKSVGPGTGWIPRPIVVRRGGQLVAAAPAYVKDDSYGEYIFDWSWAEAAERAGIRYYPKVVVAVPFTPATGPRILVHPEADRESAIRAVFSGLNTLEKERRASGTHVLFCLDREAQALEQLGWHRRATHQYHWRNAGYGTFDDFLSVLRSEPRKQIRKERRRVAESGVEIVLKEGLEITSEDWRVLDRMYRATGAKKWGRPYLTPEFFEHAREAIGPRALAIFARHHGRTIAATLSFARGAHLYGRYWGAIAQVDCLHFELCYYRLIEYAIAKQLTLVEAGAQGEHKLKRGFVPVAIHSVHHLVHPALADAVGRFLEHERREVLDALPRWGEHAPFREGEAPQAPPIAGLD